MLRNARQISMVLPLGLVVAVSSLCASGCGKKQRGFGESDQITNRDRTRDASLSDASSESMEGDDDTAPSTTGDGGSEDPSPEPAPENCGDGILDGNEACDEGGRNSDERAGACNSLCQVNECDADATRPCPNALGDCALGVQTCVRGRWQACSVVPSEEDTCEPGNDADCNGVANEDCGCLTGTTRSCAANGAVGNCARGVSVCQEDGTFGPCSIQPADADSCEIIGDDANCDGVPNGDCPCDEGEMARSCGPSTDLGICERGVSECIDGTWSACEGAVFPALRDCGASEDGNCDGVPDNTLDDICRCAVGETRECATHPGLDGEGPCQAGEQTCIVAADGSSSDWGPCLGSVGPEAQDSCVVSDDSNCDGTPNGNCDCLAGETSTCSAVYQSEGDCADRPLSCSEAGRWPALTACEPGPGDECETPAGCPEGVWDAPDALYDQACYQ